MRLRDIITGLKNDTVKYIISHDGKSRKVRRAEAAEARRGGPKQMSFNPPVGITAIRTLTIVNWSESHFRFQSPSRDHRHSDR